MVGKTKSTIMQFQLTLPEWGATCFIVRHSLIYSVSTHAPRVGSDDASFTSERIITLFQLTLPEWGATSSDGAVGVSTMVSTHAPRVGSDLRISSTKPRDKFQLTLPEWGATRRYRRRARHTRFQLTLPEWGATTDGNARKTIYEVSTHAPRVGSDYPPHPLLEK